MNKKKKGDKAEKEIQKYLESSGYIVCPAPRTMRRICNPVTKQVFYVSASNDYYNLFDGVAKSKEVTVWYQVKSKASHFYQAKKEIKKFHDKYNTIFDMSMVALRVSRQGWIIETYSGNDWIRAYYDLNFNEVEHITVK